MFFTRTYLHLAAGIGSMVHSNTVSELDISLISYHIYIYNVIKNIYIYIIYNTIFSRIGLPQGSDWFRIRGFGNSVLFWCKPSHMESYIYETTSNEFMKLSYVEWFMLPSGKLTHTHTDLKKNILSGNPSSNPYLIGSMVVYWKATYFDPFLWMLDISTINPAPSRRFAARQLRSRGFQPWNSLESAPRHRNGAETWVISGP